MDMKLDCDVSLAEILGIDNEYDMLSKSAKVCTTNPAILPKEAITLNTYNSIRYKPSRV